MTCQAVPAGSPYLGIKGEECLQAMHVVLPDGTVLAGERALPEIATRLRKYHFAGVLFKLPGALALSRILYRWFAGRRYRIAAILFHMGMSGSDRRRDEYKGEVR
jgi:predicted DCC family thiol-disulfide oxidoreductase YuxK